jgi:cytoskeletal protein CcmA (bactofilin family)
MDNTQITTIGPDAVIRGEFTFQSSARILGQVEGKIVTGGQLHVGEHSVCKASVDASVIIVDGTIEGDVLARERLELSGTAIINGDITTAKLIVAEGASFTGHCTVSQEASSKPKGEPAKHVPANGPRTQAKPARQVQNNNDHHNDLDAQLAGLESKLASFSKKLAE